MMKGVPVPTMFFTARRSASAELLRLINHSSRYSVVGLYARALPRPHRMPCVTSRCQTAVLEAERMRLALEMMRPARAAERRHREKRFARRVERMGSEMYRTPFWVVPMAPVRAGLPDSWRCVAYSSWSTP